MAEFLRFSPPSPMRSSASTLQRPAGLLRVLKEEGGRGVYLVEDPREGRLVVKRWPNTPWDRCKRLVGLSQAQRQLAGARRLVAAGIATPEPLGGARVPADAPDRVEIRLRFVEGELLLERLRVASEEELRRLGGAMGELLARLDRARLFHRDAKPSNFVVTPTGALVAIDPVGVRRARGRRERIRYRTALACEFTPAETARCAAYLDAALGDAA